MYSTQVARFLPLANPASPFATTEVVYFEDGTPPATLEVHLDRSRTILSRNDSPDLGFRYSVNPYRGCFHGCAYCYARPTHEYLSFGAGTDFERKIVVKPDAPELLREALSSKKWDRSSALVFSGVTDCYQPLEATYRLTRRCLEVCAEAGAPVSIITKSPLVERDIDVLLAVHRAAGVSVTVSIPFAREEHARALEPYVATPSRRFRIIERLVLAGVPVGINVAPLIPGLNEEDVSELLERARDAGATWAGSVLLRLPGHVKDVFEQRLREKLPLRAEKVLARIRETQGGKLYDASFGVRGRGAGPYAEAMRGLFERTAQRMGFHTCWAGMNLPEVARTSAVAPVKPKPQLSLFGLDAE